MAYNINDYPYLFHKYGLGLANPTDPIPYTVIKEGTHQPHICHFHIFNIDQYDTFQPHINLIIKHYSILITYCTGTLPSTDFPASMTLLRCLNKGYDIGGKFCALDYIQSKAIEYEYILFLHSKSLPDMRQRLYTPLIGSDQRICELKDILSTNQRLLGIFPIYIAPDDWAWQYNMKYHEDLLTLLDVKDRDRTFAAGNCMILRKSLLDRIFTGRLQLFYNMLNTHDSFDINWFVNKHKLYNPISIQNIYKLFQKDGIGNNIPVHGTSNQFPDGMIEHAFERIWVNVINEMGGEYFVVY